MLYGLVFQMPEKASIKDELLRNRQCNLSRFGGWVGKHVHILHDAHRVDSLEIPLGSLQKSAHKFVLTVQFVLFKKQE